MKRFAELVAPLPPEEFFSTYWEKRPLILNRPVAAPHGALLSLDEVDRVLTGSNLDFPMIRLVRNEEQLERSLYTFASGRIDALAVTKLFAEGTTIILDQLQRHLPALRDLCADLEDELGVAFHTNVYLTPPGASGFKVHYDTHDVFILQVVGAKDWELFVSPLELPLPGQGHDEEGRIPGALTTRFKLEPGDLAYLPRGIYHHATASEEGSLHITLGVVERSWSSFMLEAVSEVCLREVELRRALPVGFGLATFDSTDSEGTFRRLWARLTEELDFAAVSKSFAERSLQAHGRDLEGQLREAMTLDRLTGDSLLIARPARLQATQGANGALVVEAPGVTVTFPSVAREAALALLGGRPMKICDLPGSLDIAGKLTLARRMIREGLVRSGGEGEASRDQ